MKILICGFSGAGKSTFLKKLQDSASLDGPFTFFDLDSEIARSVGVSSSKLGEWIAQNSEKKFREVEEERLFALLKTEGSMVISLGGGSLSDKVIKFIDDEPNDSNGTNPIKLVFLDEKFEICLERIKKDPNRLLSKRSDDELKKLYVARMRNYSRAHLVINPDSAKLIDGITGLVHTLVRPS